MSVQERAQPETLRLKGMAVGLTVSDIEASLHWYRDLVGFHVWNEWRDDDGNLVGAGLRAGSVMVMISQDDWGKGKDRKRGEAVRLQFMTSSPVDEVAEAIRSRGGSLASEPADMPWGGRAFNLEDPDGFQMTVSDWTGETE